MRAKLWEAGAQRREQGEAKGRETWLLKMGTKSVSLSAVTAFAIDCRSFKQFQRNVALTFPPFLISSPWLQISTIYLDYKKQLRGDCLPALASSARLKLAFKLEEGFDSHNRKPSPPQHEILSAVRFCSCSCGLHVLLVRSYSYDPLRVQYVLGGRGDETV